MMKTDLYQILTSSSANMRLHKVIEDALSFLGGATITAQHGPSGRGQPAKEVSDLHSFRKRSGYYRDGAIVGLDETIDSLAHTEDTVHLGVIETDRGAIALWINEHNALLGIMVTEKV